jgi:hypothetical protein
LAPAPGDGADIEYFGQDENRRARLIMSSAALRLMRFLLLFLGKNIHCATDLRAHR